MSSVAGAFPYAEDGVVEGDFTQQFRYPVITSPWPRWNYITAVVVDGPTGSLPSMYLRPTDRELTIIGSWHEHYCTYWYGSNWFRASMRAGPFDIDGSANGRILAKFRRSGGWGYGHRSWENQTFCPNFDKPPMDLIAVLDLEQSHGSGEVCEKWIEWKRNHVEIFGKGGIGQ